ncbi:hypothetical protein [Candidatus Chlorohelix sp.]|uniref:arsenate reductase/protein-tyrosine-phosphatase family protein n=1 Tax=Candidatus Chlorohelix sp. TaxID=3139201 RepID=UPI003067EA04
MGLENNQFSKIVLVVCNSTFSCSMLAGNFLQDMIERNKLKERINLITTGLKHASHKKLLPCVAEYIMKNYGLDLTAYETLPINLQYLEQAAVILVMESKLTVQLEAQYPLVTGKIRLFSELSGKVFDITEPVILNCESLTLYVQHLREVVSSGTNRLCNWLDVPLIDSSRIYAY